MGIYDDSKYKIKEDLEEVHEKQLLELGNPGTWGTGKQRLAIAGGARQAGIDAGLFEEPENGSIYSGSSLSSVAKNVVNNLAVLPKDFDESSYQRALKGGLTEEEFVEIVGIVTRIVDLDVFARGIGVPLKPLPEAQSGEPSRERPETATQEQAWVPTVPNLPEGGEIAKALYGEMPKPYIVRGLSLVPDEMKKHIELEQAQYMPLKHVRDFDYQHHKGLTRAQVEVVAGRVSAINECFY